MSTDKRMLIILGVIALAIALLIGFTHEYRMVVDKKWTRVYKGDSKEPYGTWLFKESLREKVGGNIVDGLPQLDTTEAKGGMYIYVGGFASKSKSEIDTILRWTRQGNTAVIIASDFGDAYDSLTYNTYTSQFRRLGKLKLNFYDSSRQERDYLYYEYNKELDTSRIISYSSFSFWDDEEDPNAIGYADNDSRMILYERPMGTEGILVFLTMPDLVSNIGFQQEGVMAYIDSYFATLPTPTKVYWDDTRGRADIEQASENPLKFILSERTLRLAYYMTMLLALLYLIFRSRRLQRIIPLKEKNENTSLEYINTLSDLYQSQQQHGKLIAHMERIFYHNVEKKYFLRKDHPDFVDMLSKKSRQTTEDINTLLERFKSAREGQTFSNYQLNKVSEYMEAILA